MNTLKIDNKNVRMIAHRGVSRLETENTAAAFIAAGNRSYFGIETDVHVTSDGEFVIIHDDYTGRVGVKNINVEECTYEQVRKIYLKSIYGEDRGDLVIPSLREYIDICKRYDKKCILELKNKFTRENIKKLIREFNDMQYLKNVIFISFDFENMIILRELLPDQELQYLHSKFNSDILSKLNRYSLDFDVEYRNISKRDIDVLHENNHKVNCWTCDDKKDAEKLIEWGADFITSNILE